MRISDWSSDVCSSDLRHVDLTWQLPLTPSIRYIKVYRADDNEHFEPIAIRPVFAQKYTDFVPYPEKTYYYKIAWVDYDYLESPFSDVIEATTHVASDSERSEERRVGKECVRTCRSRGSPDH